MITLQENLFDFAAFEKNNVIKFGQSLRSISKTICFIRTPSKIHFRQQMMQKFSSGLKKVEKEKVCFWKKNIFGVLSFCKFLSSLVLYRTSNIVTPFSTYTRYNTQQHKVSENIPKGFMLYLRTIFETG